MRQTPVHMVLCWAFNDVIFSLRILLAYTCSCTLPLNISIYVGIYVNVSFFPRRYWQFIKCVLSSSCCGQCMHRSFSLFYFLVSLICISSILHLKPISFHKWTNLLPMVLNIMPFLIVHKLDIFLLHYLISFLLSSLINIQMPLLLLYPSQRT